MTPSVRADVMVLEVLEQRASEGDVDHLLTAADAEHGDVRVSCLPEQAQLGLVQLAVHRPDLLVLRLAIEGGIDVPASRQQQAVHLGQGGSAGWKLDRLRAGRLHRPAVGHVVFLAPPRARRDPDPGLVGHRAYRAAAPAGTALPTFSNSRSMLASSSAEPWTLGPLNQFFAERNQYPPA